MSDSQDSLDNNLDETIIMKLVEKYEGRVG